MAVENRQVVPIDYTKEEAQELFQLLSFLNRSGIESYDPLRLAQSIELSGYSLEKAFLYGRDVETWSGRPKVRFERTWPVTVRIFLRDVPLEDVPLLIDDPDLVLFVKWRLTIGK